MQSELPSAGGGVGSDKSTQALLGLQPPPPPPSLMSAQLLACPLTCLHAHLPVCMLTAHRHAPVPVLTCTTTPTLACTHPRPRLHARTHAHACMHAPTPLLACAYFCSHVHMCTHTCTSYAHTSLIHMHTCTFACSRAHMLGRKHVAMHARTRFTHTCMHACPH